MVAPANTLQNNTNSDEDESVRAAPTSMLLLDAKRKSAFLPYRPQTVLTNLQRGNTEATFCPVEVSLSFHERAGQALHWAASYGQLVSVQLLVSVGANVNSMAPDLVTPLLLAAAGGHNDIVRYLLEHGAHSSHMDIVGNTALMYSAAGNHPHTCNELLAKDLDLSSTNENGETAYSLAVEHGSHLAQALLEQYMTAIITAGAF
ncbi:DNA-binding protein RFXANK isoform X2 [Drosophila obscura]|uniref:DNA-binding protein RFXANK isoform X2 n=1 Tax=Drosophila obscura TaxID=7282 RepID=UPI000BA00B5F|nr:DNA-binding protein RFXANK isoform X2 [Drosophila obscura]